MGWNTGPRTWGELERILSGRPAVGGRTGDGVPGDGNDSPAWTRHRGDYRANKDVKPVPSTVPYAELHAHSSYSFLDGASSPDEMAEEAYRLDLKALALTDHDGMYGVVQFFQAAKDLGLPTVYGSELTLRHDAPRTGIPDPEGAHLLVLARHVDGYRRLSAQVSAAHMEAGEKGLLRHDIDKLADVGRDQWMILTGCRKGAVRQALAKDGARAADHELGRLIDYFGRDNVAVELTAPVVAGDDERNAALADLAAAHRVPIIGTTGAHFAVPERRRLAMVMAAIRARRTMDEIEGWLAPLGGAHLRSGDEMAKLLAAHPEAIDNAVHVAQDLAFELDLVAPELPPHDVPDDHDENSWLRKLTMRGAGERYGPPAGNAKAYEQIEHELQVIEDLNFPGYFLIVHDIVKFCRDSDILCQGRGSAANSAVCYALKITNVDPIKNDLLFERFLSIERDGPPDIDVDIESDRREEAIQHVYNKYGRRYAAQVANVITYRGRSAVRDAARALGYSIGQQDAWSKQVSRWYGVKGDDADTDGIPKAVVELAEQLTNLPRHLGIHSGGMVICDGPIDEVCPTEWARMPNRSVLQWDKDDCAAINLVKFDLLGLGMLSALHYMLDLVKEHKGIDVDLAKLDLSNPEVYDMICKADTVGVFQIESRAQMGTLPRLRPDKFTDLVIEVAIIRPGPIQGGSVHPFIRRKSGDEKVAYDHSSMKRALKKTLGVPLFQEQLMQLAQDVAGFTPPQADALRRAMGSKRSKDRMEELRKLFQDGAYERHGIDKELADRIFEKLKAFANFGFPESHAHSFASLVFYSAWFKLYHPAAFCAALLRAQPMGFYSPQSLVADARRHGVIVRGPDVNASLPHANLENGGMEVRLGLATVRNIGQELAEKIVAARDADGPFADAADLSRRTEMRAKQLESLATAGALGCFDKNRHRALWDAGAAAAERADRLPLQTGSTAPMLPGMDGIEEAAADVWATGVTPTKYPTEFLRDRLDAMGVVPAGKLLDENDGARVLVAGAVTHRQRPATASGITFINLEDETGMVNVVCSRGLWARYRKVASGARALVIRGRLQNATGAVSVVAEHLQLLDLKVSSRSRDWQ
ncbi:error-prone DNA polymerase [Jongsikchunia kroppenstedtii]|uniref:error-prone DNA polymerase n=1 Tax=Jongsikchunia kroppenstedtii TaxID=1121721 RepID=UPI00036C103B|nr:error-prone DNA polymerase [Jongsikchunia kroppenstedtii]